MSPLQREGPPVFSDVSATARERPVFVTGGSGFVGGAVVEHLVNSGADVRALARSDVSADVVAAKGAIPVRGGIDERRALVTHMSGC